MKKKKSRETHARVNESWRPMTRSKQGLPSLLLIKTMMIPVPLGVDLPPSLDFFMKKVHVLPESLATTSSYEGTTWGISRGCYFVSRMEEDAGEKNISCVYEKRENREEDDAWSHVIGHFVFLHCWFLMCYFSSRMSFPDSAHHVFHVLFLVFHTLFPLHLGWRDVPYLSWRRKRE